MSTKIDPNLLTPASPNNTNMGNPGSKKNIIKFRRCHLILNPGDYPYYSMYMELFRKYTELIKYITKFKSFRYLVSGLGLSFDKKDTQHLLHIHIYAEFKEKTRFSIKKILGAHMETNIDSQLNVIQYVKDQELGIIEEIGDKSIAHRPTIKELENYTLDELKELDCQQYHNIVSKEISRRNCIMDTDTLYKGDKLKVYYIYGPSGSGKSRKAIEILKENGYKQFDEIKHRNGYYLGISGCCKACLYDDFRPNHMEVSEFITFIDYNIHNLDVKGGSKKNIYELIIITSINNPHNIYRNCTNNEETRTQWIRRMKIIKIDN